MGQAARHSGPVACPGLLTLPASQSMHTLSAVAAASVENLPAAQSSQASEAVEDWYVPAAQSIHAPPAGSPAGEYLPVVQASQHAFVLSDVT